MELSAADLERLRRLDDAVWAEVERRYYGRILLYIQRFVGELQRAEDLTQDTFLAAVRAIDRYDPSYTLEQFLFGIAHNKVIDYLRRSQRSPVLLRAEGREPEESSWWQLQPAATPAPSRILVEDEDFLRRRRALVEALRELVARYWEKRDFQRLKTLELVFVKRWPHARIAAAVGLRDEKAVAGIKFRALRALREGLRARDPNKTLFRELWREGQEA